MSLAKHATTLRFLLCGGLAALVNWAARLLLSLAMPFPVAIIFAAIVGMGLGFWLYRTFVWPHRHMGWKEQLPTFVLVNLFSAGAVLGLAMVFRSVAEDLLGPGSIIDAVAHAAAIGCGAVLNFAGHGLTTFKAIRTPLGVDPPQPSDPVSAGRSHLTPRWVNPEPLS